VRDDCVVVDAERGQGVWVDGGLTFAEPALKLGGDRGGRDVEPAKQRCGGIGLAVHEPVQKMLGADVAVSKPARDSGGGDQMPLGRSKTLRPRPLLSPKQLHRGFLALGRFLAPPEATLRWVKESVGLGGRIVSMRRLTLGGWHANHGSRLLHNRASTGRNGGQGSTHRRGCRRLGMVGGHCTERVLPEYAS